MNIMTTFVIPTTPTTPSTSVPSEYQFTKTRHAPRTPHPIRSRRIFNQTFNSASSTPAPLEAQFTRTTPVLQATPSTATSKPIPSEVKFTRTTPMLPTTPSSSPAPLDVQFTWTIPMLPTTPSTMNSAHSQSEILATEKHLLYGVPKSRGRRHSSLSFSKRTIEESNP